MGNLDFDAITLALATRYDPANVVAPAGLTNIQGSFAYGPPAAAQVPLVVVNPPDSGVLTFGGQERAAVHQFTVDFFGEGMADPPREAEAIAKWLGVLIDLTLNGVHLGLPASVALTWTGRYETGQMNYAGQDYPGIRLFVAVTTTDGISPTP